MIGNDDVINAIPSNKQHTFVESNDTVGLIDSNATSELGENMLDLAVARSALNGGDAAVTYDSTSLEFDKRSPKTQLGPNSDGNQIGLDLAAYYSIFERHLLERPDTLLDQELLELILYIALGGGLDATRLARVLLARYRTFGGVISSPPHDLSAVPDLGKKGVVALKLIKASVTNLLRREISTTRVMSSFDQLIDYLSVELAHERVEHLHVLFLDARGALLADELHGRGTIDRSPVYPREIVRRCLDLDARSIVMVHNHPSGNLKPSQADVMMTKAVERAVALVGVTLNDHVIIGRQGYLSFKQTKLL